MEFYVARLQTAFFMKIIDISDRTRIAQKIKAIDPQFVSTEPILLPVDNDAPAEIPALVIEDPSTGFSLQLGRARFDTAFTPEKSKSLVNIADASKLIQSHSLTAWEILSKGFSAKSNRLGYIATFVSPISDPITFILERFIKKGVLSEKTSSIQFNYLNKFKKGNLQLNQWVKISGTMPPDVVSPILIVEFDINTVPDLTLEIRPALVRKFFTIANEMIEASIAMLQQD